MRIKRASVIVVAISAIAIGFVATAQRQPTWPNVLKRTYTLPGDTVVAGDCSNCIRGCVCENGFGKGDANSCAENCTAGHDANNCGDHCEALHDVGACTHDCIAGHDANNCRFNCTAYHNANKCTLNCQIFNQDNGS